MQNRIAGFDKHHNRYPLKSETLTLRAHQLPQVKGLPLFSEMTAESLDNLLQAALLQRLPSGFVLLHEGDHADFLHVLLEGLLEIFTEQSGVDWGISLVRPISTFLPAAVVGDQVYLHSVRTLQESRVLLIPADRVRVLFEHDAAFARMVARELSWSYRGLVKKLKGHLARSSIERLANWILTESQKSPSAESVVLPFDRGTLASHIGTTREHLSRSLAQLTDHGVRIRGREVIIDRRELLEAFARPQQLIDDPEL
jgi:CRP/FNR family transcriptional activator FtrB